MNKHLSMCLQVSRSGSFTYPKGTLIPTKEEERLGYVKQDGTLRVTRTRKSVHWVGKSDDPLVWLADACAFGLKRYFGQREHGEDFCLAIAGGLFRLSEYNQGHTNGFFHPR